MVTTSLPRNTQCYIFFPGGVPPRTPSWKYIRGAGKKRKVLVCPVYRGYVPIIPYRCRQHNFFLVSVLPPRPSFRPQKT